MSIVRFRMTNGSLAKSSSINSSLTLKPQSYKSWTRKPSAKTRKSSTNSQLTISQYSQLNPTCTVNNTTWKCSKDATTKHWTRCCLRICPWWLYWPIGCAAKSFNLWYTNSWRFLSPKITVSRMCSPSRTKNAWPPQMPSFFHTSSRNNKKSNGSSSIFALTTSLTPFPCWIWMVVVYFVTKSRKQ